MAAGYAPTLSSENASHAPRFRTQYHPLYKEVITWLLVWPMLCLIARQAPYLSGPARDATSGSDANYRLALYPVLMFQLSFTLTAPRKIWTLCKQYPLAPLGILLIFASLLWTASFPSTINSGIEVALSTCFACFLVVRFSTERLMQLLMMMGVISALLSIFFVFALPSYGIFAGYAGGAWQGICDHKNTLGISMAYLLTPVFFVERFSTWQKVLYASLILFMIIMSQSRGAWLYTLGLFFFIAALFLYQRFRHLEALLLVILAAIFLVSIVAIGIVFADRIAPMLGKSASMSGRTDIYREVWISITRAPILGYGYGSFWGLNPANVEARRIGYTLGWTTIGYSESGVLELALQLGFVGVALVAVMFIKAVMQGIGLLHDRYYTPKVGWFLSILFVALLTNIDAGWLLNSVTLDWILILIACIGLNESVRGSKLSRRQR